MPEDSKNSGLTAEVERTLREHSMVSAGERVLAAVSAGLDSMVMLEVLHSLSAPLGFGLVVAHFDHGLRGPQAALAERELVGERCRELGLELICGQAKVAAIAEEHKLNLQDAARRERYRFFWDCCQHCGCSRLATGHHRDDQAETVLIRLLSGSGLIGLAGIPLVSRGGRLIRPLLEVPRTVLERFAHSRGLAFAVDASNLSQKYLRNRVRLKLIPEIERKFDPCFRENLNRLAAEAGSFRQAMEERAGRLRKRLVAHADRGARRIDCLQFEKIPPLVGRFLVRSVVFEVSGGAVLLSGRALNAIQRLILDGPSGRVLDLPGGLRAGREFENLLIARRPAVPRGAGKQAPACELPEEGMKTAALGKKRWEFVLEQTDAELFPGAPIPEAADQQGWFEQWFNLEGLKFPLTVGVWRAGDRMRPFGLGGSKKIKKLFQEKRIPASSRCEVPLLRDDSRQVLWLCGVARSELAPVVRGAKRLLRIRARRL